MRLVRFLRGWHHEEWGPAAFAAVVVLAVAAPAWGAPEVLGAYYRPDEAFPEFTRFWREREPEEAGVGDATAAAREPVLGASVHVLVRNAGTQDLVIGDVLLEGVSLKSAIAFSDQRKNRRPASLFFSKISDGERETLIRAGEPIWWRVDPASLAPGCVGEITVRLRFVPKVRELRLELRYGGEKVPVVVAVREAAPRIEGISFTPGLDEVFVYLKHPKAPGQAPAQLRLDGRDVMGSARIGADPRIAVVPVVIRPGKALDAMSLHCVHAAWADGSSATAGIRAWADELAYGVWGGQPGGDSDTAGARRYVQDLREHHVNVQMPQVGSGMLAAFYKSEAGGRECERAGLRFVLGDVGKWNVRVPYAYFIKDEPDAADAKMTGMPRGHEIGSLAQWVIDVGHDWRTKAPSVPQTINVDLTFKPYNYYIYGQVPDLLMADPYYQPRLREAHWKHPERLPLYRTATFVRAISTTLQSAAAPKPTHIILYANAYIEKETKRRFRYPAPEEKRIEAYYALGAGAKGISYWWFTPGAPARGMGSQDADAKRLWREVGLIGAELRTAEPLILRSCPGAVPVKGPEGLLVRCLLAGLDTMIVVVVNEQHVNDDKGTTVTPVNDAVIRLALPSWLDAGDAFEVQPTGIRPVAVERQGAEAVLRLGTVNATCMVVMTADKSLRGRLEAVHAKLAPNVARLLAGRPNG